MTFPSSGYLGYQSRYVACRTWTPESISDLYVMDRKKGEVLTYPDAKPFFQGGALTLPSFAANMWHHRLIPNPVINTGAPTFQTQNLNTIYTSAGATSNCIAGRFTAYDNLTVSKLYFQISSYAGTASLVDDIDIELRSGSATAVTTGVGGLLASATVNPGSVTGWVGATSFNTALTAGSYYWIVVGDPDGEATNFARVRYGFGSGYFYTEMQAMEGVFAGFVSSNGGTSLGDSATMSPMLVIFSNGECMGLSENTATTVSSGNERGVYFPNGLPFDVIIHAAYLGTGSSNNISGTRIWTSSSGPSGTPFLSGSSTPIKFWTSSSPANMGYLINTPTTIGKNTPFRGTLTFSTSTSAMVKIGVTPTGNADLRLGLPGRGSFYYTEASGGSWSNDQDYFPVLCLVIEEISSPVVPIANRIYPAIPSGRVFPKYGI